MYFLFLCVLQTKIRGGSSGNSEEASNRRLHASDQLVGNKDRNNNDSNQLLESIEADEVKNEIERYKN